VRLCTYFHWLEYLSLGLSVAYILGSTSCCGILTATGKNALSVSV
jgi:hypothetical protein